MNKFATLRNEILNININGLELRVRADKVDFLFGDGDPAIRWVVNQMLSNFDTQRQTSFDEDMPCVTGGTSQAKMPEGITLNMVVQLREEADQEWGSYMTKGAKGTSWYYHSDDFAPTFDPRTMPYPNYFEKK